MDPDSISKIVIKIAVIVILLVLSAFFSSSETALTAANKIKLKTMADEGNKKAKKALKVLDNYGNMLAAILIGNNVVNLSASALATILAGEISLSAGIMTAILTVTVLIFSEILPKNLSAANAEKYALSSAGVIYAFMIVLKPVVFVVNLLSRGVMRLFRIDPDAHILMTESELRNYVDVSHEDGVIETDEKEMIINVFEFGDSVAKDVMIPRADMITADKNATLEDILNLFKEHMYTRIPIYEDDSDNIVGVVNVKDILLLENLEDYSTEKIMRAGFYTVEFKKTDELLTDMRSENAAMALVLNEYGSCVGMVTLEDLLEEIVGEIRDEYDADEENLIQKMEEDIYLIEGSMKLDDINDELGTELHSEDYDSIGGLVIEYLEDRLPEDGETITTKEGYKLKVSGIVQNRIQKVILTDRPKLEETEEEE